MNVIASALAGQGVARVLETLGANPNLVIISAVLSAFFISIGLSMWRRK